MRKETVYKDIHIHVLIKTVEGQDVESIATKQHWLQTAIHRVCQNEEYATITLLSYLIHARLSKTSICSKWRLNDSWEDYQDIHKANKINWQKANLKQQEQKYTVYPSAQIDALLTRIMDNEASRAYTENMPEPRMAYITNRRLFENAFEIAVKEQVSAVLRRSRWN